MHLEELTEAMRPGAVAAIEKSLTFQEMMMAFRLAVCREARQRTDSNNRAAILLHMAPAHFNALYSMRALKRTSFKKGSRTKKVKEPA